VDATHNYFEHFRMALIKLAKPEKKIALPLGWTQPKLIKRSARTKHLSLGFVK
jgi:hypothetical protein